MAKKKPLPPRRKRMGRPARLQAARHWIPTYSGKSIVHGYAKWFGVDLTCSLKELELLGVPLDPVYVERLRVTLQNRVQPKRTKEPERADIPEGYGEDWDDDFACIAGFTSGGAPFGVTWEEAEALDADAPAPAPDDDDEDPVTRPVYG
jgi:hypothetical protein